MRRLLMIALALSLLGCGDDKPDETGSPDVDADGDGVFASEDCDDGDAANFPGNEEICDGQDNDCDGLVDDDDDAVAGTTTWYGDGDGDGYGLDTDTLTACEAPTGYVATGGDCEDGDAAVNPAADEVCDGQDNDCDGLMDDEDDLVDPLNWYVDADVDGFGDASASPAATGCVGPAGYVADNTDCDDGDDTVFPGNAELCDGLDNDCDVDTDEDGVISVGAVAYSTIQDAVGGASSGDTVMICPGDYVESVIVDRDLTLMGSGYESVWLDAGGAGAGITVQDGAVTIKGLTISGGTGTRSEDDPSIRLGGAIAVMGAGPVEVRDCYFLGNSADYGGAIQAGVDATLAVYDSRFESNAANSSGGAIEVEGATVTLDGLTLVDNSAVYGGGMFIYQTEEVQISNSTLEKNEASDYGGGILVQEASANLDAVTIEENTAFIGAGLAIMEGSVTASEDTEIFGNATTGDDGAAGGGVMLYYGSMSGGVVSYNWALYGGGAYVIFGESMSDMVLEYNECENSGGGLYVGNSSEGLDDNTLEIQDLLVTDNTAIYGGGMMVDGGFVTDVGDSVFSTNEASDMGGGVLLYEAAELDGCLVSENTSANGGGVVVYSSGIVVETIIQDNLATESGGGIYVYGSMTAVTVDISGNMAVAGGGLIIDEGTVFLYESTVDENVATDLGGGAYLATGALISITSDWGEGPLDNDPDDVVISGVVAPWSDYGADASFGCSSETGTCE